MAEWLTHLFAVGLPALAAPTVVLLLCARWGRAALKGDYPEDIQRLIPESSRAARIAGWSLASLFLISLIGACAVTTWTWIEPGSTYFDAYGMALGTFALFCLIDLLIVDWLLICWWRPQWIVIPGTEHCEGWGDYMFHLCEQLSPQGLAALFGLPAVIAAAVWLAR